MGRTDYFHHPDAPKPNSLVPATGVGRPVAGTPAANDEADAVRWFAPHELDGLDIHPRMRQQLADYLAGVRAHVD